MAEYLKCDSCGYYPVKNMTNCPKCGKMVSNGSYGIVLLVIVIFIAVATIMVLGSLAAGIKSFYNIKKGKKYPVLWLLLSYILGVVMLSTAHYMNPKNQEEFDWFVWLLYIGNVLGVLSAVYVTIINYGEFIKTKSSSFLNRINVNISKKIKTISSKSTPKKERKTIDPLKRKRFIKIGGFSLLGVLLILIAVFVIKYFIDENKKKEIAEKQTLYKLEVAIQEQHERDVATIKNYLGTYLNEATIGYEEENGFEIKEEQGSFIITPINSENIDSWFLISFNENTKSVLAVKNGTKDTVKFADLVNGFTLYVSNTNYIKTSSNKYSELIAEKGKTITDSIITDTIKAESFISYQNYKTGKDNSKYTSINLDYIYSSSNLEQQGNNSYEIKRLADDNYSTAWVEGVSGYGIGEKIEFSYTLDYDGSIIDSVLLIANGYQSSNTAFSNNSRVKQFKIIHDKKLLYVLDLKDEMGLQKIVLTGISYYFQEYQKSGAHKNKTIRLQLEVTDVYKGEKYDDTAITDIYFLK